MLKTFLDTIREFKPNKYFLLTKNGKEFDLTFILARLALQTDLNKHTGLFLLEYYHFDLQIVTKKRISLDTMAQVLGCTPKSGKGKNAIKLWNEKKYKELKEYNSQDFDTTEEVFLKWKRLQEQK